MMTGLINNTLLAILFVTPTLAAAQSVGIEALAAPALIGTASESAVFHSVSAPEVIATPVNQSQSFGGPTPAGSYAGPGTELMKPLNIPLSKLKCCDGEKTGRPCKVDRYLTKPAGINPNCLICVKEPYIAREPVTEQVEAVLHQCFETEVPFEDDGCEDGTWYKKQGKKVIRRLRPCTVMVDIEYEKKVVRYQDVWYHVRCN